MTPAALATPSLRLAIVLPPSASLEEAIGQSEAAGSLETN